MLLLDVHQTKAAITDGQNDKQIDAIVVEDGEDEPAYPRASGEVRQAGQHRCGPSSEVLSAWTRLKDFPKLQAECSGKLAKRWRPCALPSKRGCDLQFELLTTGRLTPQRGIHGLRRFQARDDGGTPISVAGLTLVDSELLETRLSRPRSETCEELTTEIAVNPDKCLVCPPSRASGWFLRCCRLSSVSNFQGSLMGSSFGGTSARASAPATRSTRPCGIRWYILRRRSISSSSTTGYGSLPKFLHSQMTRKNSG